MFYVKINKLLENDQFVYYEYQFAVHVPPRGSKMQCGQIKIAKDNGDVHFVKLAEGDSAGKQAERAGWALMRHWKNGEYPDKTFWNS